MNIRKIFGYGLIAILFALAFIACDNAIDPDDGLNGDKGGAGTVPGGGGPGNGGNPTAITYIVTQTGGIDGITDSAGIVFTFSASVDSLNLTAADITVGGKVSKGSAALSGTVASRTLSPITVNDAGLATVSIAKDGIEAGTKNVIVYKAEETAPEYWSITWNFNGGTAGTGAQHPTLIEKSAVLTKPSPDPVKVGNTFGGWYSNSGLTQTYSFASLVTSDLNLYAKWEAVISPTPTHIHNWGSWTDTEINIQERICGSNPEHIEARQSGPAAGVFTFVVDSSNTGGYSVSRVTTPAPVGTVRIPAYYRQNSSYNYQPVTAIGKFFFCTSLSGIDIPDSIKSIDDRAFEGCSILTNITVGVNNPNYASEGGILYNKTKTKLFAYPSASDNVTIPANVTEISRYAFVGCYSLSSITVDGNNPNYASQDGMLCNKAKTTLIQAPGGISGSVTIPASVTSIGDYAFENCSSPDNISFSITIPQSVTSIGQWALACSVSSITFAAGSQLASIGDFAFCGSRNLTSIEIPASVTSIGNCAFTGWSVTQTIYVKGHANNASANAAWGNWKDVNCSAKIMYWDGSEWIW